MVPLMAVEIDEMCKAKRVIIYVHHIYHLNYYRILSINIYVSYFKTSRISRAGLCTSSPGTSKGGLVGAGKLGGEMQSL